MLAAGAGGTVNLHLNVLVPDLHIVGGVLNFRNHLHRRKGGLPPGVGVKGRHPHQPVHPVFPPSESRRHFPPPRRCPPIFSPASSPLLVVQDLVGVAVGLRPAGIHPVEHLAPILGPPCRRPRAWKDMRALFPSYSPVSRVSSRASSICWVSWAKPSFNSGSMEPSFSSRAISQMVAKSSHWAVIFRNFSSLDSSCLAFTTIFWDFSGFSPKPGGFLHGVEPLQLLLGSFQVQRSGQRLQLGLKVI